MRKFLSYLIVFTIIFMITILSFIGCKKEAFPTEEVCVLFRIEEFISQKPCRT
ncbi:unnamed protein product [marine sediment metagenome]|uniref:Lipoprotein n=1 Tax=marine sediment metagenome TaxID=412755 RepID=X1BI84_9ZZZZ